MKKIIALACMITCIFGFTACGSEKEIPAYEQEILDYQQEKLDSAKQVAKEIALPYLITFMEESQLHHFDKYTAEETSSMVAYEVANKYGFALSVDGNAMKSAVISFNSAAEAVGTVTSIGEPDVKVDGKTIVIDVPVIGTLKNAKAELIFGNDGFMRLESASLNEEANMSDLMTKAALNTLIGMGTVFIVLILISVIIALFGFIPKIQAKMANRGKEEETKIESIDNTIAQIVEKEDVTDDFELVAVIAAAIAASEGQTSTDGFVVRSIRKVNRRK